jgi:hypothetical protein
MDSFCIHKRATESYPKPAESTSYLHTIYISISQVDSFLQFFSTKIVYVLVRMRAMCLTHLIIPNHRIGFYIS